MEPSPNFRSFICYNYKELYTGIYFIKKLDVVLDCIHQGIHWIPYPISGQVVFDIKEKSVAYKRVAEIRRLFIVD